MIRLLLLMLITGPLLAATIDAQTYANELRAIAGHDTPPEAGQHAATLAEASWQPQGEADVLAVDRALLKRVATHGVDDNTRRALLALADQVCSRQADQAVGKVDPADLTRLANEQRSWKPEAGGSVAGPLKSPGFFTAIADRSLDFLSWLGNKFLDFVNWLHDLFFPDRERSGDNDSNDSGGIGFGVWLIIGLAVVLCAVLVAGGIRRRRQAEFSQAPKAKPARWDEAGERPQSEWERMAAELLAAGRDREALRAYYNACLAGCFTRGHLSYRRGRTNWEYLALLPRDLDWRQAFTELTKRFDLIWYGHHKADDTSLSHARQLAATILRRLAGSGATA